MISLIARNSVSCSYQATRRLWFGSTTARQHHPPGVRIAHPRHRDAGTPTPEMEVDGMPIAADYPFLNILWTMIIYFCWAAWIVLLA